MRAVARCVLESNFCFNARMMVKCPQRLHCSDIPHWEWPSSNAVQPGCASSCIFVSYSSCSLASTSPPFSFIFLSVFPLFACLVPLYPPEAAETTQSRLKASSTMPPLHPSLPSLLVDCPSISLSLTLFLSSSHLPILFSFCA